MLNYNYKILFGLSIFLLAIGTFSISDSFGSSDGIPELFIDIPQDELNDQTSIHTPSSFDSLTIQTKNIYVDTSVLDGDTLSITAFSETFTVTKYKTSTNNSQTVWWGNDKDGNETNLIIDGDIIFGTITTAEKTYYLDGDETSLVHTFTELDLSLLPNENDDEVEIESDKVELFRYNNLPTETQNEIILFANSYIGGHDYQADGVTLTIDVTVGFTTAADDADSRVWQKIGSAINNANRAYDHNGLPIELNIESNREIRGYTEEVDTGSGRTFVSGVTHDKHNLRGDAGHPNSGDLDGLRGNGLRDNADVVILVVHTLGRGCGSAGDILAESIDRSIAVINDSCLAQHTLTHEIGHLQGAHHNPEITTHPRDDVPFQYQHGYVDGNVRQRTIMAYNAPAICDPLTLGFVCTRDNLFSDPNRDFFNTRTAAGTEADNFNAKVLYGSIQHIASLRGGEETFDNVRPQGAFAWVGEFVDRIFDQGDTMDISATFDEPIHDNHPPTVTISDGSLSTPIVMTKSSNTAFTASHALTSEIGNTTLEFSNAKDLFLNDVIATATGNTGSVTVNPPDTTAPIITLNPPNPQTIELGDGYTELDATTDDGSPVTIDDSAFVDAVGTYSIFYDSVDAANNPATQVVRTVNVVDTTKPVITLTGVTPPLEVLVDIYTELGAFVNDNDLTYSESVTVGGDTVDTTIVGSYTVTYNAPADASGNTPDQVERIVIVQDTTAPIITLNPPNPQSINRGNTYSEMGASCTDNYDGSISNIVIVSNVDTSLVGTYQVTYDCVDAAGNDATTEIRTVNVIDVIAPVIALTGITPVTIHQNDSYVDAGATCNDDTDGVIAVTVGGLPIDTAILGTNQVTYDCQDTSGNDATQVIRTVNVIDGTAPIITLNPPNPQQIFQYDTYNESGATCNDDTDGDIPVVIVSNVDTDIVGTYQVTYDCADTAGNDATTEIRTVNVVLVGDIIVRVYSGDTNVDDTFEFTITGSQDATGFNEVRQITTVDGFGNVSLEVEAGMNHIYAVSETSLPEGFELSNSDCGKEVREGVINWLGRTENLRPDPRDTGLDRNVPIICQFANTGNVFSHSVTATINLDDSSGDAPRPTAIAVNESTNTIYTANLANSVSIINGDDNSVSLLTAGIEQQPSSVAVNESTGTVYVSNFLSGTVSIIDSSNTVTSLIPHSVIGAFPLAVGVVESTNTLYTGDTRGLISVIDSSNTVTDTISVTGYPGAIAVNESTNKVYVGYYSGNKISVIDRADNSVSTINVGNTPRSVAVNESTDTVYVTNKNDNTVSVIDANTNTVIETIPVGTQPEGIAVNEVTNIIYVTNSADDTVSIIDGTDNSVIETIPVGDTPRGVTVNETTNTIYVVNNNDSTVSVITQ